MIEQINKTVMSIESLNISVPYLSVRIEPGRIEMQVPPDIFDKIMGDDPILILMRQNVCEEYPIERSILIGTVLVFALYEE